MQARGRDGGVPADVSFAAGCGLTWIEAAKPHSLSGPGIPMPAKKPIERLRAICMALPGVTETISHGEPTWWVRGRTFASTDNNHHRSGRVAVVCKAPLGFQAAMVEMAPERFFRPPYVGHKGWVGLRIDLDVDWSEVKSVVEQAYRINLESAARPRRAGRGRR